MVEIASILILATALVLGLAHSLDPDHIVAVTTLICNYRSLRKSIASAAAWGGGHSIVLLIAGLLLLVLRVEIPASILELFEIGAGIMLITIGVIVIRPFLVHTFHRHEHQKERTKSQNLIPTEPTRNHDHRHFRDHDTEQGRLHLHRSALTGTLQGLGGSAAIMLVTVTTVSSVELGLVFILIFGVGVIVGMVSISCLVSSLLNYSATHLETIHEKIKAITGTISISFGIVVIIAALIGIQI